MESFNDIPEQKKYYDNYWSRRDFHLNRHELYRLSEIIKAFSHFELTQKNTGVSICDLGCGLGWLSNELTKFGKVYGVDLSEEGVTLAEKRWPAVEKFEAQDILKWDPKEKFNIVVSSEVIEHIQDKTMFMSTIDRILEQDGYLILTTPNGKVKQAWDEGKQGAQLIEEWATPVELRDLVEGKMNVIYHSTFLNDFAYNRVFRVLSAPKALKLIEFLGLMPIYDGVRDCLKIGLYQIIVAKKK